MCAAASTALKSLAPDVVLDLQAYTLGADTHPSSTPTQPLTFPPHTCTHTAYHSPGTRPELLQARASAVQATYLVYPGTQARAAVPYLVADAVVTPPEQAPGREIAERLLIVPGSYQLNTYEIMEAEWGASVGDDSGERQRTRRWLLRVPLLHPCI